MKNYNEINFIETLSMKEYVKRKFKGEMRVIFITGLSTMILSTIIAAFTAPASIVITVELVTGGIFLFVTGFWQHNISDKPLDEVTEKDLSFRYIKAYNKYLYDNSLKL